MKKKTKNNKISEDQKPYNKSNQVKIFNLDWLYEDSTKGYSNTKKVSKLAKLKKSKKAI